MKEPRRAPSTCATALQSTMATTYTISDLAREFDLTPRARRFYEDMGLLQPGAAAPVMVLRQVRNGTSSSPLASKAR